jgi:ubiquitin thioesterase OTU1
MASVGQSPTSSDNQASDDTKRSLIFKFTYRGKQYELATLNSADTVGHLRAVVCSMLNIENYSRINLKTLQPTRVIEPSDDSRPLSDVFRQTREKIVVEDVQQKASDWTNEFLDDLGQGTKHHKPEVDDRSLKTSDSAENSATGSTILSDRSPIRPRKTPREQNDQVPVCSSTGYLLRHPVPSNNSCLFISVHFCLTHGLVDDQIGKSMRKIIAETVASDHEKYDDAFLGKSNAEYCRWILDDNNWGGAIELSILCKYYETEIVAIDVKNKILNRFGEDSHYPQRMLLLYDGLHYDPLKFQPYDENKPIQTLFPTENTEVLTLAEEIAKELNQSHQYTDLKTMSMICSTCNIHLDAKNLSEHAEKTGHESFREIA